MGEKLNQSEFLLSGDRKTQKNGESRKLQVVLTLEMGLNVCLGEK